MTKTYALEIHETAPGQYLWSVVQPSAAGGKVVVIDYAMRPLPTEIAAVVAGNAALERIKSAGSQPAGEWGG